ncbi:Hypothetical predicted protein [Pelobates cultripes]|uniref:Uncharacterized protein n=1 Tax=Pelobates cultripes TaxID=61616 RepID=A0AAD1SGL7_PELCU|nr:Hypothetical predicted protein [Pelobates cultripes]
MSHLLHGSQFICWRGRMERRVIYAKLHLNVPESQRNSYPGAQTEDHISGRVKGLIFTLIAACAVLLTVSVCLGIYGNDVNPTLGPPSLLGT